MSEDFSPQLIMVIKNLETLKVMSDTRRLEILEVARYAGRPVSTKEIAAALKLDPHKLYYHIKLLEEHGIFRVAETKTVANLIEKYYVPAALTFTVDKSLFTPGHVEEESLQMVATIFDETVQDIQRALAAGVKVPDDVPQAAQFGRSLARLSPKQAGHFAQALLDLLHSMNTSVEDEENTDDAQTYSFTFTFFPMVIEYDDES